MGEPRDYVVRHQAYDDPASSMSFRLGRVREHLRAELDRRTGPARIRSVCAGDGRSGESSALGSVRFAGEPAPLPLGRPLLTFLR